MASFLNFFSIYLIVGLAAGLVTGLIWTSLTHNERGLDAALVLSMGAFPIWLSYRLSSTRLKNLNVVYAKMASKLKEALQQTDYFNTGELGGIAIDVKNKMIATVTADGKYQVKEPFLFACEKIKIFRAIAPDYIRTTVSGTGGFGKEAVRLDNLNEESKAYKKTGLYIDLDDIAMPKVFVQMPFDEAEKWLLILEKLTNGTLETQGEPLLYP